jgi:hypothetical protein
VSVPAPEILAPKTFKNPAKSATSGSIAAFLRTVCPSAKQAAIIKFSVPVTVTISNRKSVPFNRLLDEALM